MAKQEWGEQSSLRTGNLAQGTESDLSEKESAAFSAATNYYDAFSGPVDQDFVGCMDAA